MRYTFYCECGEVVELNCSMKDLKTPSCDRCSKEMKRDYSGINLINPNGRNDPSNVSYWKNGKTSGEISEIQAGEKPPY